MVKASHIKAPGTTERTDGIVMEHLNMMCNMLLCFHVLTNVNHLTCACFSVGVYVFGLFTTDIFANAGQLITGSMAPYFLSVCQPNYTALGCQDTGNFVSQSDACTGDPDDITRARKTFPSKEAALSLYTAVYLAVSVCCAATCSNNTGLK